MNKQFLPVLDSIDKIGQIKHRDVLIANAQNLNQKNFLKDDVNKLELKFVGLPFTLLLVLVLPLLRENTFVSFE